MSGVGDDLSRRISAALDAGGVEADDELSAILAEDADARLYAADLSAIDEALGALGAAQSEPDWDAMAARIDARLDAPVSAEAPLDDLDVTAPPAFAEEAEPAPVVLAAPPPGHRGEAEVVSLDAARRRRRRTIAAVGGLAAAAAVGLGITAGLTTLSDRGMEAASAPMVAEMEAEEQSAGAADAPAPPPAAPAEPAAEPVADTRWEGAADFAPEAESVAEMPAAAAATPARRPAGYPADGLQEGAGGSGSVDALLQGRARAGGAASGGGALGLAPAPDPSPRAGRRARRRASRGVAAERPRPSPTSPTSSGPSRATVVETLRSIEAPVRQCMAGARETATAVVRIDGASGRVQSVALTSRLPAAARSCIEARVRGLTFPTHEAGGYAARYVYRPAPVAGGSMGSGGNAARRRTQRASNPAANDLEVGETRER